MGLKQCNLLVRLGSHLHVKKFHTSGIVKVEVLHKVSRFVSDNYIGNYLFGDLFNLE